MISDLKQTFNYSFFQEISDEWLFWEWNDEKTVFYFTLTPELFEKYSNKEKHIYWYDYHPWFIDMINHLIDLWVIESYEKISTNEYNKEEKEGWAEYFYNNWNSISENFFYFYKMEGWKYELHYNLEKLNLFKEIIHDNKNIKLNIKKQLFKTILYFIDKRRFDFPEFGAIDIFDIEIILEELDIKDDLYIFNNITLLLYSICNLQDRLHIARLLNYLVNNVKWSDKEIIINSINWDVNFKYYSNEEFDESDNAKLEFENTHHLDISIKHYNNLHKSIIDYENYNFIWNIWYKIDKKDCFEIIKKIDSNVKYNLDKALLTYNWNFISFTKNSDQELLINELYNNLWQWITKSELKTKWFTWTIKDSKANIFKNNFKKLTVLEKKKLINYFENNWEEYIMMVWVNK